MFLLLDDDVAHRLLAQHEQRAIDDGARATFAALRRLTALLCGLTFASLLPDLSVLPASPPRLAGFYAELRAGKQSLQIPAAAARSRWLYCGRASATNFIRPFGGRDGARRAREMLSLAESQGTAMQPSTTPAIGAPPSSPSTFVFTWRLSR